MPEPVKLIKYIASITEADRAGMVTYIVIGVCCGITMAVLLLVLAMGMVVYADSRGIQQGKKS